MQQWGMWAMTDMPDTPDGTSGDFLTVLSSELIAEVMEEYFNKKMYRQKVKVVDLQPQGSGYAFSLAFVKDAPKQRYDIYASGPGNVTPVLIDKDVAVDNNGSFVHTQKYDVCVHGMPRDNTCYHCLTENARAKEILETATNVDYTVRQRCQHGIIVNPDDPCPQCQLDTIMVTGGSKRDTKGKFTSAKKDKVT